jgi:hypothetical protein
MENGLWENSILPVSSHFIHRVIDNPAEVVAALSIRSRSSPTCVVRALPARSAAPCFVTGEEEHRRTIPRRRSAPCAFALRALRSEFLAIGPLPSPSSKNDVTQPRRTLLRGPSRSSCRTSCAAGRRRPAPGWHDRAALGNQPGENLEVRPGNIIGDIGDDFSGLRRSGLSLPYFSIESA